jgi:adenylate kinase
LRDLSYASEDIILSRLTSRRVCPKCGRIYNLRLKPPLNEGLCDADNEPLVQRKDDTEEMIRKRYQIYLKETAPLIEYFAHELIRIDGDVSADKLLDAVRGELCPA